MALTIAFLYRSIIARIAPSSTFKVNLFGVEIETTIPEFEKSIEENFRGRQLSEEHWVWLRRLRDGRRIAYDHKDYEVLRPLRNTGLIREYPKGQLSSAEEIEITQLVRVLLDAYERRGPDGRRV